MKLADSQGLESHAGEMVREKGKIHFFLPDTQEVRELPFPTSAKHPELYTASRNLV